MKSGNLIKAGALDSLQLASAGLPRAAQSGPMPAGSPGTTDPEHEHEPEIRLHREEGDIVAIEVVCGCGRTTFIECQYQD